MLDLLNEQADVRTDLLFLALLGASGAGKSHVAGTAPGKIAYLCFGPELHGVASARKSSNDVIALRVDSIKGADLKPDESYKRLLALLNPEALKKAGIETVVLDGLTELEKLIRETAEFANRCSTKGGGHDKFAEVPATVSMMDKVFSALRTAQDKVGVHVVVLGILDVQEADKKTGAIEVAVPYLSGYRVAVTAIQQFGDILTIGKLRRPDGTEVRRFQTGGQVSKVSKDKDQNIKKFINFDCRLQMPAGRELPEFIKDDLKEVVKLKKAD